MLRQVDKWQLGIRGLSVEIRRLRKAFTQHSQNPTHGVAFHTSEIHLRGKPIMLQFYSSAMRMLAVVAVLAAPSLAESPRITVVENLSDAGDMRDCVMAAAEAASVENLDGFLEHFTARTQKKLRKQVAMLFVHGEFGLEILDCHVIKASGRRGELALRYTARLSERQVEIVAVLDMHRENGYWKISHERVASMQNHGATCSPSRSSYLGGDQIVMR